MFYAALYNQTEYTFLKSTLRLSSLFEQALTHEWDAIGIADQNMSGVYKFYQTAKKYNLKPIIGLQVFLGAYSQESPLLLFAKNQDGYKTLLKISSLQETKSDLLTFSFLKEHQQGLTAIIPVCEHEGPDAFFKGQLETFIEVSKHLQQTFQDIYFGVSLQADTVKQELQSFLHHAKILGIPALFLHKQAYVKKEDKVAYQTLRAIDSAAKGKEILPMEEHMYVLPKAEVAKYRSKYPELFENLQTFTNSVELTLSYQGYQMPKFPLQKGQSSDQYLTELCKLGLNKRLKKKRFASLDAYKGRLLHELDIIQSMKFSDYFLVVYDFVRYAKQNKIYVGPGRGSAPGSLVSYSLGITDIDPLQYDLLFERFLNPERITMPDIDMDFPDNERDRVIEYVREKYGKEKVAHISTFGTFKARLAIRDVARVINISDAALQEVMQYIPPMGQSLAEIINDSKDLQKLMDASDEVYKLLLLAQKIEGLPRHTSTHAAGVIISDRDIMEYSALKDGLNGIYQTQFEANDLEQIGLVKIDFLGLKNLNIIATIVNKIYEQEKETVVMQDLPLDDVKTYQLIASGNTDGIFQLESAGMKNVLRKLKASTFMDIVNANALYRPGPMEMIDTFIRRKFQEEKWDYLHPDVAPILHATYGIIVFQEQIMLIAQKFAGYTLAMADILRRAVSKKDAKVLEAERTRFVSSCLKREYTVEVANALYDYIVKFANYGFNKSHAVSYALVGYQMAYLKAHYYPYFMSVLLSNSIGSAGALERYVLESRKNNVQILLPSIQHSDKDFVVTQKGIYFSLLGIRGFGVATCEAFLAERKKGLFADYQDFVARTKGIIPQSIIENMIYAGALDDFGLTRKTMIEKYEQVNARAQYSSVIGESMIELPLGDEEYSFEYLSTKEKEALGFSLHYNLFVKYEKEQKKYQTINIEDLQPQAQAVRLLVVVKRIKEIKTKKQEDMAFVELQDETGTMDAVIFPKTYEKIKMQVKAGYLYIVGGKCEIRNDKKQFILENVYILN